MKVDDSFILDIAETIQKCNDVVENEWDLLSFVFDVGEGHMANSGFLYSGDKVIPASASIRGQRKLLSGKIIELQKVIHNQCNYKFKQLLIQMERETSRIKIDFEFDDANRWSITPSNIKQMREELRPVFS